jgi:hypothetical protein
MEVVRLGLTSWFVSGVRCLFIQGTSIMPGNPKECRQNALRCAELAQTARTPELKRTLVELSKNWLKMAIELERARALLDQNPPSEKKPT